jgi:hypothetical protein
MLRGRVMVNSAFFLPEDFGSIEVARAQFSHKYKTLEENVLFSDFFFLTAI